MSEVIFNSKSTDRRVYIQFDSPTFSIPLDEVGLQFGDMSDEQITAKDIADLIESEYSSFEDFIRDWMLDTASVFIQLDGFEGEPKTHAEVEL
jgi:hypothetical protein